MRTRRSSSHRDSGLTLVELIVTVALIGLAMTVVAAAIVVIFRTEEGVIVSTAESHRTQQVVSYLPLDIESGPRRASAYRASIGGAVGDHGTGCDELGNENVLRIDVADRPATGQRRQANRLSDHHDRERGTSRSLRVPIRHDAADTDVGGRQHRQRR